MQLIRLKGYRSSSDKRLAREGTGEEEKKVREGGKKREKEREGERSREKKQADSKAIK